MSSYDYKEGYSAAAKDAIKRIEAIQRSLDAMTADRDEWKQQHENLLAVRQQDLAALTGRAPSPVGGSACQWPSCQPEAVQQQVADQAYRELYSGESVGGSADLTDALTTLPRYGLVFDSEDEFIGELPNGDYFKRADVVAIASRPAALAAPELPTNDEVYAQVQRQRGNKTMYVSTNAVNDVMAAVRVLAASHPQQGEKA